MQRGMEEALDEFFNTDLLAWARRVGIKPKIVPANDYRLGGSQGKHYSDTGEIFISADLKKNPAAFLKTYAHEVGHAWFHRMSRVQNRYLGANVLAEEAAVDMKGVMVEMEVFGRSARFRSDRRELMENDFHGWRDKWLLKYTDRATEANPSALDEFYRRFPGFNGGWSP